MLLQVIVRLLLSVLILLPTEVLLSKLSYLIVRRGWVDLQEGMNGVMPWRIDPGMLCKEMFENLAGNLTISCATKDFVQR